MNIQPMASYQFASKTVTKELFGQASSLADCLKQLVKLGLDAEFSVRGVAGKIVVMPNDGMFFSSLHPSDLETFFKAPRDSWEVRNMGDNFGDPSLADQSGAMEELLWTAAYFAPNAETSIRYSEYHVIELACWPNLTRLPATVNTLRICALLTGKPYRVGVVWRKLGISRNELYRVINAADAAGMLSVVYAPLLSTQIEEQYLQREIQQALVQNSIAEQQAREDLWDGVAAL